MKKLTSLFALLCASVMMFAGTTVTKTVAELATANSWDTSADGKGPYKNLYSDDILTVKLEASDGNTGKLYKGSEIRMYQSGSAKLVITAEDGYVLTDVTLTLGSGNNGGILNYNSTAIPSNSETKVEVSGSSVEFTIGNSGTATNGRVDLKGFAITYEEDVPVPTTTLSLEDVTVKVGKTAKVKVDAHGGNSALTWAVEDETIATVDDKGVVTGVKEGTTTVTATVKDSDPEVKAEAKVTVTAAFAFPAEGTEITCAQAVEIATELGTDTSVVYTVVGYVTDAGSLSGGQQLLWLDDAKGTTKTFQSFYGNCPTDADGNYIVFAKDDKVKVTGRIFAFGGNAATGTEIKNGTVVGVEGGTPVKEEVITPSKATEIANALKKDSTTTETYTIEGWVVDVADNNNLTKQNFYLSDTKGGSDKFYVYGAKGEEKVNIGYKVRIKSANLQNYKGNTPEAKNGIIVVLDNGIEEGTVMLTPTTAAAAYETSYKGWKFTLTTADNTVVTLDVAALKATRLAGTYVLDPTNEEEGTIKVGSAAAVNFKEATLKLLYVKTGADKKPVYEITFDAKTAANTYAVRNVQLPFTVTGSEIDERLLPSEAAAIAAKLEDKANAEGTYTIYGYVTAIERDYSTQYKNQSFWLADEKGGMSVFEIFNGKCEGLTENVKLNSLVEVTGATITRYGSTYETAQGATFVVKEEGDGKAKEGTPVTVAEALTIANALEDNVATETYYTITGIVDEVKTPWEDNQYKNSTFYIVDQQGDANRFYAYRVKGTEVVVAGDKVKVSCYIIKYVGDKGEPTPENTSVDARYEKIANTAVENIFQELNPNAPMYNVLGIQVGKDYKGVVIQNGQKYLLK